MYDYYDDYEEYDYSEFDPGEETSFAEDLLSLSKLWRAVCNDTGKEIAETIEAMREYEDAFAEDRADDPEYIRDCIAFNGIRVFAGMFGNAAETIGNFLDATAGLLNGDGPALQVHIETPQVLERTYKVGDHLKISRGVYTHHGLYAGDGKVIHYSQGYDKIPEIREALCVMHILRKP